MTSVAFSPDGQHALTSAMETTARLWDLAESPITSVELIGHTHWIHSIAFSPDGRLAATGSEDTSVRFWELAKSPITCQAHTHHTNWVTSVIFSRDGRFVLTGSNDNIPQLWDLTKYPITCRPLKGHTSRVTSIAFSPDGRFALTGSWDDTARLWDLTKSPIASQELRGHRDVITSVAFSPDGRIALLGSSDSTISLWHIEYVDKTLSLLDHLLILKLSKYEDHVMDDALATQRLKMLIEGPLLNPHTKEQIPAAFYRVALPVKECSTCLTKFNHKLLCLQLACCKKYVCKNCLRDFSITTAFTWMRGFTPKCRFCLGPADRMEPLKRFENSGS